MTKEQKAARWFAAASLGAALAVAPFPAQAATVRPADTVVPHLSCGGGRVFVCSVSPTGGTAPYVESWNGGSFASQPFFAGQCFSFVLVVTVAVRDSVGNTGSAQQTIICNLG
ncbi:hypothetical protein [Amycolatopsis sp. DG1A-15b]|uniref:hypothetical protein n=1 Tax=Amycolatopsis sp. DG1A-15b TaxID=3052846 RepID=UPI00255BFDFB|nr:hypothetical protein [Amycolatopsis sp. DG1A-15b]WIX90407.1 hypothetical protein QRY02_08255 [Amycolatopsis sp. DG1A-15b]